MAPLPQNNTARLWLDYTSRGIQHSAMVRFGPGANPSTAEVFAAQLADAMRQRMFIADSVLAARYSGPGTLFSFPIFFTPVVGVVTEAGNVWAQDPESTFLTIPGRSSFSGRDVRFCQFTAVVTPTWPTDNRYEPGDAAVVDTWRINITELLSTGGTESTPAVAIDNNIPTWYNYVNISQNAYWQRKQRRLG